MKKGAAVCREGEQLMGFINARAAIEAALPRASKTGMIVGTCLKAAVPCRTISW
jgi:hypothetical protein